MPSWYESNSGAVLSFSIDKYCYLLTRILPPYFDYRFRLAYSRVETVSEIDLIQHPALREGIRNYTPDLNLEINHHSDLPARSGIGSSSAFAVGLINSLSLLSGHQMSKIELAKNAIDLEQKKIGEAVGSQDQIACAFGGLNFIRFGGFKDWEVQEIKLSPIQALDFEDRLYLVFSGISRSSSDITSGLLDGISSKSTELTKIEKIALEANKMLIGNPDFDVFGEMLRESWNLKKKSNKFATVDAVDQIIEQGLQKGALGAKVLGAGGGGFILFWLRAGDQKRFRSEFKLGTHVPVKIDHLGATTLESTF